MPSAVIRDWIYEPESRRLIVEFTSGRRYLYFEVPPDETSALDAAFSKGKRFNAAIRDAYDFVELEPAG